MCPAHDCSRYVGCVKVISKVRSGAAWREHHTVCAQEYVLLDVIFTLNNRNFNVASHGITISTCASWPQSSGPRIAGAGSERR